MVIFFLNASKIFNDEDIYSKLGTRNAGDELLPHTKFGENRTDNAPSADDLSFSTCTVYHE